MSMANQTAPFTSQGVIPILISLNISANVTTTLPPANFSNELIAYKPMIFLLLFYTIIFEKYSRR